MLRTRFLVRSLFLLTFFIASCARSESHETTIYYVATTGNDSNPCTELSNPCLTINGALAKANDDDRIIVAAGTYPEVSAGPYPVERGLSALRILSESLWIQGAGPGVTIIDTSGALGGFEINGNGSVRLEGFTIQGSYASSRLPQPGSCIDIRGAATVTIENVEATICYPSGINNSSTGLVTLTNVSVSAAPDRVPYPPLGSIVNGGEMQITGSSSTIEGFGGPGIVNAGTLTMVDGVVQNNGIYGVYSSAGEVELSGVTIRNNDSGLKITGGTVTVIGSEVSGNNFGIALSGSGSFLILQDSLVSENTGSGIDVVDGEAQLTNVDVTWNGLGVYNTGTLLIQNSHIFQNQNGGVYNQEGARLNIFETTVDETHGGDPAIFNAGTVNIENSLIANNIFTSRISVSESAIVNDGVMTVTNSTISGNQGTGIYTRSGNLSLSYVTIAENGGNGFLFLRDSVTRFANVLVVKNGGQDCGFPSTGRAFPFPTMSGVNIDTDGTCRFPETYSDAAILLDSLADNDGPTFTHALMASSPALDAATGACPASDQRSAPRPVGSACDVGAYEAGPVPTSLEGFEFPTLTPGADILIVEKDFPCYTGPGPQYNTLSTLKAGTEMQIVGYGFGGGWLVAFHPTLQGRHCWIDENFVSLNIPLDQLRLIAIPPKPTATPSPVPEKRQPVPTVCATTIADPKACD